MYCSADAATQLDKYSTVGIESLEYTMVKTHIKTIHNGPSNDLPALDQGQQQAPFAEPLALLY